ncbi:MAG TPA: hypothetical protein VNT22_02110 [Baekduia sp.]|nr:hypothetical protein [Baekduia sp.]
MLSRVVGMLVARAQCPIDTLDNAMLLSDAIAAHAPEYTGAHTSVGIKTTAETLELRVGPFEGGAAARFIDSSALPDIGNIIERVADSVRHEGDTLLLTLRFG